MVGGMDLVYGVLVAVAEMGRLDDGVDALSFLSLVLERLRGVGFVVIYLVCWVRSYP